MDHQYQQIPNIAKSLITFIETNPITTTWIIDQRHINSNNEPLLKENETFELKKKRELIEVKSIPLKEVNIDSSQINEDRLDNNNAKPSFTLSSEAIKEPDTKKKPQISSKSARAVIQYKLRRLASTKTAEEKSLLEKLPIIEISIGNIIGKKLNNEINFYYQIMITIDHNEPYLIEHRYYDFLDFERQIKGVFIQIAYPDYYEQVPILMKVNTEDYPGNEKAFIAARRERLEKFLEEFIEKPVFINQIVLDFLKIQSPYREPFLAYHQCITTHQSEQNKKNSGLDEYPRLSELGRDSFTGSVIGSNRMSLNMPDPEFVVKFEGFEKSQIGDRFEYIFIVYDRLDEKITWKLRKSYADFKALTDTLSLNAEPSVSKYFSRIPKPSKQSDTSNPEFLNSRKEALQVFMNTLLQHRSVYIDVLYEFFDYDVIRRLPISTTYERKLTQDLMNTRNSDVFKDVLLRDAEQKALLTGVNNNKTDSLDFTQNSETTLNTSKTGLLDPKNCSIKITGIKEATQNGEKFLIYELNFNILASNGMSSGLYAHNDDEKAKFQRVVDNENAVDIQIKQYKRFKDFEKLQEELFKLYEADEALLPLLPARHIFTGYEPKKKKSQLEVYFGKLLNVEKIVMQRPFIKFFRLDNINMNENSDHTIVYNYCDITIYDNLSDIIKGQ